MPIVDGACPEHCLPVRGDVFDEEHRCVWTDESAACSLDEWGNNTGFDCQVRVETGEVCIFSETIPYEPQFVGWQQCSAEVANLAIGAWPVCNDLQ